MIYHMFLDETNQKSDPELAHRTSRYLLDQGLKKEKGLGLHQEELVTNMWGKPRLSKHPDVHFNVSHCDGMVACAIADAPVGIDVEKVRAFNPYAAGHACSPEELDSIYQADDPDRMFFRYWTLKESCVKAMGIGLTYPLKKLVFSINGQEAACLDQPDYRFTIIEDEQQFVMAVCTLANNAG